MTKTKCHLPILHFKLINSISIIYFARIYSIYKLIIKTFLQNKFSNICNGNLLNSSVITNGHIYL